jgi:hypothetical protein
LSEEVTFEFRDPVSEEHDVNGCGGRDGRFDVPVRSDSSGRAEDGVKGAFIGPLIVFRPFFWSWKITVTRSASCRAGWLCGTMLLLMSQKTIPCRSMIFVRPASGGVVINSQDLI